MGHQQTALSKVKLLYFQPLEQLLPPQSPRVTPRLLPGYSQVTHSAACSDNAIEYVLQ